MLTMQMLDTLLSVIEPWQQKNCLHYSDGLTATVQWSNIKVILNVLFLETKIYILFVMFALLLLLNFHILPTASP